MFVAIAEVETESIARVLVTALKAHGFHPLEGGDGGLPGVRCPTGGIEIQVPQDEAGDAGVLAAALLAEMQD